MPTPLFPGIHPFIHSFGPTRTDHWPFIQSGLGALVAEKFAREGSNVAINYVSSRDAAEGLAAEVQSKYAVKAVVIQGVCFLHRYLFDWTGFDDDNVVYRMRGLRRIVRRWFMRLSPSLVGWMLWFLMLYVQFSSRSFCLLSTTTDKRGCLIDPGLD